MGGIDFLTTLEDVIQPLLLKPFDASEIKAYFRRFEAVGLEVDEKIEKSIKYYCGGHPWLLDLYCYALVKQYQEKEIFSPEDAYTSVEIQFLKYYEEVIGLLGELQIFESLEHLLFAPEERVKGMNKIMLRHYGLVRKRKQGGFHTFSEHFHDYLNQRRG